MLDGAGVGVPVGVGVSGRDGRYRIVPGMSELSARQLASAMAVGVLPICSAILARISPCATR